MGNEWACALDTTHVHKPGIEGLSWRDGFGGLDIQTDTPYIVAI